MLDTSNAVRQAYITALNGNISYDSVNVPVYGNIPFKTPPKKYVIISDIREVQDLNNNAFFNNVVVTLDIFAEQYMTNDNGVVDNIASQIMQILMPVPGAKLFAQTNHDIYPSQRLSSRYLPLQNGQEFVARKIITISNLVNQK
jgi:hypothetical protein